MIFRFLTPFYALGAIFRSAWAKIAGYQLLVDEETRQERVFTCDTCPFLSPERRCRACGCWIDFKTLLAPEKCPRGYWKSVWRKKNSSG